MLEKVWKLRRLAIETPKESIAMVLPLRLAALVIALNQRQITCAEFCEVWASDLGRG